MKAATWFPHGIQGRHVLLGLAAFFGVMFAVNGVFTYYAVSTFGGGDTVDPYRKGLNYNDAIDAARRQAELGWLSNVTYALDGSELSVRLTDGSGEAVSGLRLGATLGRPATDEDDIALTFDETSPGRYVADVRLAPGQWVLSVASQDQARGGEVLYRLKQRIWVAATP